MKYKRMEDICNQASPCDMLTFLQICGGYPDHMTRCAALLEEHVNVDFVDINMGCPIDVICSK